jgi:cytochrome b561
MALRNTMTAYGSVSKCFHWVIFILLTCMIVGGYWLSDIPKDYRPAIYNLHKLTGLTILLLMVLRLVWQLMNVKPALPADTPCWQRWAEHVVHGLLYATVMAMPLAGWIGSAAAGKPPHLYELVWSLPIEPNKSLAKAAFNLHGTIAVAIIALVSVHVLAALYHHWIKKDDILRRMLPCGQRQPSTTK